MKILMTAGSSSLANGVNRHILTIGKELSVRNHVELRVVTVTPYGDLHVELDRLGIKWYALNAVDGREFAVLTGFIKVMLEFKPDIVHGQGLANMERLALTWIFRKVKFVLTHHGYGTPPPPKVGLRKLILIVHDFIIWKILLCRKPDLTIAVSRGLLQDTGGDIVISNPYDFDKPRLQPIAHSRKIIGTACRISEVKMPSFFMQVIKGVVERMPDVEAQIIGVPDNVEIDRIIKSIANNHPRIHFLGYRKDAPELIAGMDCFIMTSAKEGAAPTMTLFEAITARVPIAFMNGDGALKDFAELNCNKGPFAIVKPLGDIDGMVEGVMWILGHPEKARDYADRAIEVVKRYYQVGEIVDLLLDQYEKLLNPNSWKVCA